MLMTTEIRKVITIDMIIENVIKTIIAIIKTIIMIINNDNNNCKNDNNNNDKMFSHQT